MLLYVHPPVRPGKFSQPQTKTLQLLPNFVFGSIFFLSVRLEVLVIRRTGFILIYILVKKFIHQLILSRTCGILYPPCNQEYILIFFLPPVNQIHRLFTQSSQPSLTSKTAERSNGVPAGRERGIYVSANKCNAPVN